MSQGRIARLETLLGRVQANREGARAPSGAQASPPGVQVSPPPRPPRAPDVPSESSASSATRRRLLTPLEQVIETASGVAAPTDDAVTTPGTRRAPVGPPIDDLAPAAALLERVHTEPSAEPSAPESRSEPLAPEPVRAASVAPPSSPIAAASGEQLTTGRATFGELLDRALRLRPR